MHSAIAFVFGLVIGSFLNVCINRIPAGRSVVYPRSYCPACSTTLKWNDLIPVISFVMLKGRCRYCKSPISIMYPVVELLSAIVVCVAFAEFGLSVSSFLFSMFGLVLVFITGVDIKHKFIYDGSIVLVGITKILFEVARIFEKGERFSFRFVGVLFLGAIINAIFVGTIAFVSKERAMGYGDVKLLFAGGFGFSVSQAILCNIMSFLFGALFSVVYIMYAKIKGKESDNIIPFAPFICASLIITALYADTIISYYLSIFTG